MKALVIVNKHAGSFEKAQALIAAYRSHQAVRFEECDSKDDVPGLVRDAMAQNFDTIVAGGGDGTIHDLVNAIGKDLERVRVGIIPLGTGNDFGRSFGIPSDAEKALSLILNGRPGSEERVDLVRAETSGCSTICINVVSAGFGGEIQKSADRATKERWGGLAYARAALSAARALKEYELELILDDGEILRTRALNIVIGNGRAAGGGFEVAPQASPTDHRLDIVIVHPASAAQLATVAAQLLLGDYTESDCVSNLRARQVRIASEPPLDFSVDGTLCGRSPAEFTILPGALRLITNREAARDAA